MRLKLKNNTMLSIKQICSPCGPPVSLIFILIAVSYFSGGHTQSNTSGSSCLNANGVSGTCVELQQCSSMWQLLNNPRRTEKDSQFLRESACGFVNSYQKICCTDEVGEYCTTPNSKTGNCINLYDCPSLLAPFYSNTTISEATKQYLRQSRCNGPYAYSVCCPKGNTGGNIPDTTESNVPVENILPDRTHCGIEASEDRIIGGEQTSIDQFPWLTLIEYRSPSNQIKLLCGSVLISEKYVMTAAHCVTGEVLNYGTPINIRLGEWDTSSDPIDCMITNGGGKDCSDELVVIPIESTFPHPEYDPNDQRLRRNDIALVRTTKAAPYTDFIRPICLPSGDATKTISADKLDLFVSGWGSTERAQSSHIKLFIDVPYSTLEKCQRAYTGPSLGVPLWEKQICAGGVAGKDSCRGDSGGPLMHKNGNQYEVIGIVSFGPTPCALVGIPGVYTKVSEYLDWIKSTLRP